MDASIEPNEPRIELFWDRYLGIIKLFRVPEKSFSWYRRHVEEFICHFSDIRLIEQRPENLQDWFETLGCRAQLTDWQYRQKVDALRLLFCHFLKLSWAKSFDWEHWSSGAQSLGNNHVTVARTYEMISKEIENPKHYLGQTFPELYRKYLTAIRIPDYSINTEKVYLSWIERFLRFHGHSSPDNYAECEVASFLEYLVVQRNVSGSTQTQALNAMVFFFTRVLEKPLGDIGLFKKPLDSGLHQNCVKF